MARDLPSAVMPQHLTLEHLAAIASAPPEIGATALARRLGLSTHAVQHNLIRFWRAGGWYSTLRLPPCTACGQLVYGPAKWISHPACVPARAAHWARCCDPSVPL